MADEEGDIDERTVILATGEEESEDDEEEEAGNQKLVILSCMAFVYVATGIMFTVWVGGYTFVTAMYVIVQIITTIGYGDVPVSPEMHYFMTVYVLVGFLLVAGFINEVCNALLEAESKRLRTMLRNVEAKANKTIDTEQDAKKRMGPANELAISFLIFTFFVLLGAGVYSYYEACSCSYGTTHIEGCKPNTDASPSQCEATGGATKNFGEGIYMAVITMTTVGFGDYSPKSWGGRIFGVFWMIFGVLAGGNLMNSTTKFMDWMMNPRTPGPGEDSADFSQKVFEKIDLDGNGTLNQNEFMQWFLVKEGLVKQADMDQIVRTFNAMDSDGSGKLKFEEVMEYFHK